MLNNLVYDWFVYIRFLCSSTGEFSLCLDDIFLLTVWEQNLLNYSLWFLGLMTNTSTLSKLSFWKSSGMILVKPFSSRQKMKIKVDLLFW